MVNLECPRRRHRHDDKIMCKYGDKIIDSDDEIDEMAMMNALGANDTMFKSASIPIACPWPIHIVPASGFAMTSPEAIRMPPELPHRSFEYGASWVEHYYAGLIKECRKQERMDLVVMLYQWYVAQFTLDYLNDITPLSSEQFLAASNVVSSSECLERLSGDACRITKACRKLMKMHDDKLDSLPADISRGYKAFIHLLQGNVTMMLISSQWGYRDTWSTEHSMLAGSWDSFDKFDCFRTWIEIVVPSESGV